MDEQRAETMDFAQAMAVALSGGRIRRSDWNRPHFVEIRTVHGLTMPVPVMVMHSGVVGPYIPSSCDMAGRDWTPVEQEP